eukprot:scaffold252694_cov73-Cyclotella_meneghiniana.AAC.1
MSRASHHPIFCSGHHITRRFTATVSVSGIVSRCGKVHGIEVYTNEGGVTKYSGGWRWFVIPAGYLGGAFWGAVFVVFSGDRWASLGIAILFCVGMTVSLFFAPNGTMVGLNIGFIVLTIAFISVDQLTGFSSESLVFTIFGTISSLELWLWKDRTRMPATSSFLAACQGA